VIAVRPGPWRALAAFTLALGTNQMLWLNFAPLLSLVQRRYGVSELAASALVLVFPLLYVGLSIPAGRLTDRRGYHVSAGIGVAIMAAGAGVRVFTGQFSMLLLGQVAIAVSQPFIMNGLAKLVVDWFDDRRGALATGLGTMGMFLGMAASLAATPALVEGVGLRGAMVVFAAISLLSALLFALFVQPNPARDHRRPAAAPRLGALLRRRDLLVLFGLSFLGMGVFNGVTTWLEAMLAPQGITAVQAGLVGGAMILGGILGSVALPAWSDRVGRRRPFLVLCAAVALATLYPLGTGRSLPLLLTLGALHGFFLLPALALLIETSAQLAGAEAAGASSSLLLLAGNAGGVLVVLAVPLVRGGAGDFRRPVLLLTALLAVTLLLARRAPEPSTMSRGSRPGS
jgi:predicted MFS family arabinose efflux permease